MKLEIVYTPAAKTTLNSIYNFINGQFGSSSADKFVEKAERTIDLIAANPLMFKASAIDENVRVGLIAKQCSLFYRVTESSIHLLYFWDNRQEPQFEQ